MKIKKSLLIAGAVTGIGLTGVAGIGVASAATNTSSTTDNSLAGKIASTFHLDKTKVQAVITSDRSQKEADRQTKMNTELTQLVTDGKITAAQKTAILAKQQELKTARQTERASLKTQTQAERQAFRAQQQADLTQWAKDNNLSTDYLRFVMGGGPGGPGQAPADAPTASSTTTTPTAQ
jgi:hypothetical protein